ncbi:MAG: sigma-70 family RNA polymerase sigma factor [Tannerella sp.]|nr:sigma-70 family RNA polymerase sigma factor [Tannerella sp.]
MEQDQFKREVIPLRGRLFACAQRLLGQTEDAEDIVQEVFLKLWVMRGELKNYDSLTALSVQITKRLCLNRMNVSRPYPEPLGSVALASEEPSPHVQLEQKDSLTQVMRLVDRLPGLQQSILRMKHVEGLEVEEIAGLTGSNPEAVRMNLSRARKKIRELFMQM